MTVGEIRKIWFTQIKKSVNVKIVKKIRKDDIFKKSRKWSKK